MRFKDEDRIETTEMRMMCGKTLKDKVRHENIKKSPSSKYTRIPEESEVEMEWLRGKKKSR